MRKFTIGICSVAIGSSIIMHSNIVEANELSK
ncbi:UNVERIFIED_CONTAM: YSIRK-type signal peptide-containing protein [Streptococcus canis]|nr:YSIRK-type signal peptide-containing protein [Streptococcus canis]